MSITTLPSKPTTVVDIPEVLSFTGNFVYNFFTPDERVNGTGPASPRFLNKPSSKFDVQTQSSIEFNSVVPRYIRFNWDTITIGNRNNDSIASVGLKYQRQYVVNKISIKDNYSKIYSEEDFHNTDFSVLTLQSTEIDSQLRKLVKIAESIITPKLKPNTTIFESPQERAKFLNSKTSKEITSELITTSQNVLAMAGVRFDAGDSEGSINEEIASMKQVKTNLQLNNSVLYDVLNYASYDDNEISPISAQLNPAAGNWRPDVYSTQQATEAMRSQDNFIIDEYDSEIEDLVSSDEIVEDNYEPVMQPIGYIIEKFEISPTNQSSFVERFFVEDPTVSTTVDIKIKYGANYYYEIKTVAYVEIQAYDISTNKIVAAGFLVASKPLRTEMIRCIETKSPPPPTDFMPSWDYMKRSLRLTWNFPVDTQRDVKYFQVFRRASVYEPFELIKMYDFDNSQVKTPPWEPPNGETGIDRRLVEQLSAPLTYYIDSEFTKDSKFIYALCAVDAHGYSSNYSMQYEVGFDKERNKLTLRMLSVPGAPKAYPNTFLNVDSFVDTIKDEGHTSLQIVFNPEYLKVFNKSGTDLRFMKVGIEDFYRIQFINIDLQQQEDITISLRDRTSTSFFTRGVRDSYDASISQPTTL